MEGERLGPVTFSELRIKALEGKLNPRLDMAWTKGMPNWTATGEIEGLFDRRAASGSLAPTGTAEPYRPPEVDYTEELPSQPASWPGARRRSYLFMSLIFPVLWMGAVSFATPFLARQFGQESLAMGIPFLMSIAALVIVYFGIRRFQNLGMSGFWIFGNLVPILNIWLGYRLFACPAGYAFHKKLDGIGIFLAIVYWLMLAIALVSTILMMALMFGAIGTPETQKQFMDALREGMEAGQ